MSETILFNNLSADTLAGADAVGSVKGDLFSPQTAALLNDVQVGVFTDDPADGGALSVLLYSANSSGLVARLATLGTFQDSILSTDPTGIVDVNGFTPFGLLGGQRYAIVLTSTGADNWTYAADGIGVGTSGQTYYDGVSYLPDSAGPYRMTVSAATGVACYVSGTRITTANEDRPVEDLAVGDLVRTASGALRPIRWIGRRSYSGRSATRDISLRPVRLLAGCLGQGLPRRDLLISQCHAMAIDGFLVPAAELVNGVNITIEPGGSGVEYVHVELDTHDVILAEDAPSETFVDDGSRDLFDNAQDHHGRYGDWMGDTAVYCAPRLTDGWELEVIRRRILSLAGRPALAA